MRARRDDDHRPEIPALVLQVVGWVGRFPLGERQTTNLGGGDRAKRGVRCQARDGGSLSTLNLSAGNGFRAMSSVLRFKKGRGAPQADTPVDETTRDALPPPEPALLDWATLTQPPDNSHLAPCPQCGAPNGLSAASCWSCETNLLALEPFRRRREHGPAHVDESIPVLTSALEDNDPTAELPTAPAPA